MDLSEWEVVDDGIREFPGKPVFNPDGIVDMDYFVCPTPASCCSLQQEPVDSPGSGGKNEFFSMVEKDPDGVMVKDIGEVPVVGLGLVPSVITTEKTAKPDSAGDPEMISHFFFKRTTYEKEFVDMILDPTRSPARGLKPQIEIDPIEFEAKEESKYEDDNRTEPVSSKENQRNEKKGSETTQKGCWEGGGGGLTIWKWRITGIGALCSLGVAAATVCIFIISSRQRYKQQQQLQHQNQKLRFQIYADGKRIKQVVHQATRLNQALTAVHGVPLTRASITFGGYYDGI